MREKYFIKQLATFLVPLLIPIILLGSLSMFSTQRDIKSDINQNSSFLLQQSKTQLEMILNELDTLYLALYDNADIFNELSAVLKNPSYTYESSNTNRIISSFLNAFTSSKPYIQSFYLYVDNPYNRFLSSVDGLVTLDHFYDTDWYGQFSRYEGPPAKWTARRELRFYSFETNPTAVVTFYNVLVPRKTAIILNIRPKYIESLLNDITRYPAQQMFVLDEANQVIFSNGRGELPQQSDIREIADQPEAFFDMDTPEGKVNVTKVESERYKWKYISVIPHSELYKTPSRILSYTLVFVGISVVCGFLLTFVLIRRNYKQLKMIRMMIKAADDSHMPLKPPARVKDEYSLIVQNMITHFIEHRYIRTQLLEKKYRLQVMELLALQSQINPHFLYNTLHSVYWESVALTGRPNKASEMIEDLSDILSYSFSNPTETVTWETELGNTISYVNIQKKRYRDKFDVIYEYDEVLARLYTFKLVLQPLLENSIYHGIKEKEGGGLIKVKFVRKGERLSLSVIDNGVGMTAQRLREVRERLDLGEERTEHLGLYNTNKRLKLTYDRAYSLTIKSKHGFGTKVELIVPCIWNEAALSGRERLDVS
ncbi:sensor histidine kinase [Paenibacillus sp. S150]|uniref:cache domain-containing sensor histidine kinase n=1 Tax=Paenibacillus sp. S150 TaxID=2749826 RepID=UPI001C56E41B|nr:sensor histidine kinase [Paenibacillus sp. S150]MBW4085102.1 histidine kinase [Paenibacillus sp. S150]